MSDEPIEGRILDDDEKIPNLESMNAEQEMKRIYEARERMRAEAYYNKMQERFIDRNNVWNYLRDV